RVIAIRIAAAAVKNPSAPAPSRRSAADEFALPAFRALDSQRDRPRVLALRIFLAADEIAEPPFALQQLRPGVRAFLADRNVRLPRLPRPLHQPPRRLAIRIPRARQERPESPALQRHLAPAIFAVLDLILRVAFLRQIGRQVLNEVALRIPRAAQEESVPADALQQFALSAFFALLPGRNADLVGDHLLIGLHQVQHKFFPEAAHSLAPRHAPFLDLV